VGHFVTLSVE
jgi:hypothetical protein